VTLPAAELRAWQASAHAAERVNCSRCHASDPARGSFSEQVSDSTCAGCHEAEHRGFQQSRHGMRRALGLPALRVGDARRAMKKAASEREVGCTSCHAGHAFDTRAAAMDACLGCHDDRHSRNHRASAHAELWLADASGQSGASCATCHLPRVTVGQSTHVVHNQNDNLRPNEKMARGVCLSCHGLGFSLDALADPVLVQSNFRGEPRAVVESLKMVRARKGGGSE
jgi:formate-dependent nitrite reductase cytochrome c552 subunit